MRNLALLATLLVACEEQPPPADSLHSAQLTSRPYLKISVAPSTKVDLNATIGFRFTPDEHSSVLRKPDHTGFYIFTAGAVEPLGGALVLETSDFLTFAPAAGYAAPLLYPSHALDDCSTPVVTPFDNNYAAPGSVFPDPSNPGKLLMLYEAENHCPGGHVNTNFYASVGLARSLDADDFGQRWPAPGASPADRYDAIASPIPEPTDAGAGPLGDAIPSGLVSGGYLYAFYEDFPGRKLQVARAIVGDDPLTFRKWEYGWNGTGVGGSGTPIISPPDGFGCGQASVHQLELGTA
ncbi:MAG TPA: hypothetical protein VFF06_15105, partial [Polyangia bacterium]|nr:hypothetical protein [Polyangia bacterium]